MGFSNDVNLAYFGIRNGINKKVDLPFQDTQLFLGQDASLAFELKCSVNFSESFQQRLKSDDWYLYLTIFSADSNLKVPIYLDQVYGKIPHTIGNISFGAAFTVNVDGKFVSNNHIRSVKIELAVTNKTDQDPGFNSAIKDSCFLQTVVPVLGMK